MQGSRWWGGENAVLEVKRGKWIAQQEVHNCTHRCMVGCTKTETVLEVEGGKWMRGGALVNRRQNERCTAEGDW